MKLDPDLIHGAAELERTAIGLRPHRLPAWARGRADAQLQLVEAQPAGVRIVFTTTAPRVRVTALATRFGLAGVPPRAPGVFDAVVDGVLVASATLETPSRSP